jgi:hypothetical protein
MKIKTVCFAVALTISPAIVLAQFSLPGLSSKAPAGAPDLGAQQSQIVALYAAADTDVLTADSIMADALGLKDASAQLKAAAAAIGNGATEGNMKAAEAAESAFAAARQDAMNKDSGKLDAASKEKFATAFIPLTKGVVEYAAMSKPVSDFATGLKSAPLMQLPKLQSGAYIATHLPTSVKNLHDTLQSAVAFAKSNDIPVPADATGAM